MTWLSYHVEINKKKRRKKMRKKRQINEEKKNYYVEKNQSVVLPHSIKIFILLSD